MLYPMVLHATTFIKMLYIVLLLLNLGPQHPSTHGVLRLITILTGEVIQWTQPEIGLLHRSTDKLIEYNSCNASIPYFDRLDYVSTITQEVLFINGLERLLTLYITYLTMLMRSILLEFSRILNHLLAITTHAIDIGAFNPMLW